MSVLSVVHRGEQRAKRTGLVVEAGEECFDERGGAVFAEVFVVAVAVVMWPARCTVAVTGVRARVGGSTRFAMGAAADNPLLATRIIRDIAIAGEDDQVRETNQS